MLFLCLSVTFLLQPAHVFTNNNLKVSIYYESFCPDSYKFLIQQFRPAFKSIGSSLNVHMVPYGRANQQFNNDKWQFTCQHGPKECLANTIQACGISMSENQIARVNFVCCIMSNYRNSASTTHLEYCVHHLNVTAEDVLTCAHSSTGTNLLLQNGNETNSLGYLKFIPTVLFNDDVKKSLDIQSSILHDFRDAVVNYLNSSEENGASFITNNWSVALSQLLLLFTIKYLIQ